MSVLVSVPYADVPALLAEADRLLEWMSRGNDADAFERTVDVERWRQAYEAALPALTRPHGAVVTIVEELRAGHDPDEYPAVTVPNLVELNGIPLMVTQEGPVVERMETADTGPVRVTLTLLARRVLVDARPAEPQTEVGSGDGSAAGVAELGSAEPASGELAGVEGGR